MVDPVCLYDDPYNFDADAYWNGSCPPEPSPIEAPLPRLGRSQRKKKYCKFEIDTLHCFVNGRQLSVDNKPIRFESEEEEGSEPKLMLDRIKLRRGLGPDFEIVVEAANVTTNNNLDITAEPLENIELEPEITVENVKIKRIINEPIIRSQIVSKKWRQ